MCGFYTRARPVDYRFGMINNTIVKKDMLLKRTRSALFSLWYILIDDPSMTYQYCLIEFVFFIPQTDLIQTHGAKRTTLLVNTSDSWDAGGEESKRGDFNHKVTLTQRMRNRVTGSGFIGWPKASWQSARWAGRTNGHWFFNKGSPSCQPTVPHRYPYSRGLALRYPTGGTVAHQCPIQDFYLSHAAGVCVWMNLDVFIPERTPMIT